MGTPAVPRAPSLRLRLLAWLLLPLSLCVAGCAWLAWLGVATVADYVQDHDLLASAKVLSDRLIWEDNDVAASVPPSALSLFASADRDRVYLSVTDAEGNLLAGSPGFPLPRPRRLVGTDRAQWYDASFDGQTLRAVVTERAMYEGGSGRAITIAVGKTTRSRDHMALRLWWPTVAFLLVTLVAAAAFVSFGLRRELRPLVRLARQLETRDALRADIAVDARRLHRELRPVADTINAFARQIRHHIKAQRRFIADAAHQLRTPLAMQASQIAYARHRRAHRAPGELLREDMDAMWREMQASNRRLVAVTNKLLLLAQAEHQDAATQRETVDLAAAALRVVEELAALAERRQIDLGFEAPSLPVPVQAQPALLDALLSNLVDNALRYSPEGGHVTITVGREGDQGLFTVDDDGPGIPPEARERVFERFYRLAGDTEGTGLGLAIVREIATAWGAEVVLNRPPGTDGGLRAQVRFAPCPAVPTGV
ncbi:sensor histidine kinase [Ideonella sp. B7]|uniref:sensor histidine kinase n=1 Tax=Ideonella benzenivorans TaxID=2831643 RepID=UPI001CEC13A5|nr:sensor histidine kinase [Ideonella benzenivorans]MCA6218627.1 sensor histidine kinase [Ideonella benzenivorans]